MRGAFLRAGAVVLTAVLALSAAGVLAGCGGREKVASAELPVTAAGDPRIFTMFLGMNMAGYDREPGEAMHPVRQAAREALADVDPEEFAEFRTFLGSGGAGNLAAMVLRDIGGPPEMGTSSTMGIIPDISAALKALWAAHAADLWEEHEAAHEEYAAELLGPATEAVRSFLAYAGEEESPVSAVHIIPNLLAPSGFASVYHDDDEDVLYVLLGPGDLRPDELVREFARFLIADTLREIELDVGFTRFRPVHDVAKGLELISREHPSVGGYIEECLVRALAVRTVCAEEAAWAELEAAHAQGLYFTPAFYEALAGYEESGAALLEYLETLLEAVDVDAVLAGLGESAG
ncbi:MAG TPA: hypothetical protein DHW14_06280 [Clostridiales bacterium]|nr:hypothetical protein [Clostridiales bacterium]